MKKFFSLIAIAVTLVMVSSCSKAVPEVVTVTVTVPSPSTNIELIISNVVIEYSSAENPEDVVREVMSSNSFDEIYDETDNSTKYVRSAHMLRSTAYSHLENLNQAMSNADELIIGHYDWAMIIDGEEVEKRSETF